ncbi:MAG: hypothetical protein WBP86_09595, partial [Thiobacillaceae bacterium]
ILRSATSLSSRLAFAASHSGCTATRPPLAGLAIAALTTGLPDYLKIHAGVDWTVNSHSQKTEAAH